MMATFMGTTGLKIIVFRGRYFVYYSSYNGYPSGLGNLFVGEIPTDPGPYKEWLEGRRDLYAMITAELESKVLTVPRDMMQALLAKQEDSKKPIWKGIDSGLTEFPTTLCSAANDLMIEWVYVVDLDRELFSVDNRVFFDLRNIPRDRWIEAFKYGFGGRKLFSLEICPEASARVDPPEYFADDDATERERCYAIYQQYGHSTVNVVSTIDFSSQTALQYLVPLLLFEKSTAPFAAHFWEYLPGWGHETFAFREVAFAILSFAAGQLYFDNPNRFYGSDAKHETNGYLIDQSEGGEPKLMPLFGSGCHSPHQEPGSAPPGSIYWFENVLVSLVPDTAFERDAEAAIAKAIMHGLAESKVNFQVVVFSILSAIMLEVQVKNGVKEIRYTDKVSICHIKRKCDINEYDYNDDFETNTASLLEQICLKHSGFVALQNFFNVAANRHLGAFGQGRFPTEIYDQIIANTDFSTRTACAKVSATFRKLCQQHFSFAPNLTILKFEAHANASELANQTQHMATFDNINIRDVGIFTFQDRITGRIMQSKLNVEYPMSNVKEKLSTWCPVVGGAARPSMMTIFMLRVFGDSAA